MTTIKVSRAFLLAQFPVRWQVGLALNDLPEFFILKGELAEDREDHLRVEYKDVFHILTHIEWQLFRALLGRGELGCSLNELYLQYFENRRHAKTVSSNVVDAHISAIRRKLSLYNLPFEVLTKRGNDGDGRRMLTSRAIKARPQ